MGLSIQDIDSACFPLTPGFVLGAEWPGRDSVRRTNQQVRKRAQVGATAGSLGLALFPQQILVQGLIVLLVGLHATVWSSLASHALGMAFVCCLYVLILCLASAGRVRPQEKSDPPQNKSYGPLPHHGSNGNFKLSRWKISPFAGGQRACPGSYRVHCLASFEISFEDPSSHTPVA